MKEFGSDFHLCKFAKLSNTFINKEVRYYASGRHAIRSIIEQEGWKRIWIPAYFCYEVINYIESLSIEVMLYDDSPLRNNENDLIKTLPYQPNDVLMRVNYFGLREWRSNKGLPVPVIEDHTHDIVSDWAINSDADWCVASLRKSLPIAAGGILWSPQCKKLPTQIATTIECEKMACVRYEAMQLKTSYLKVGGDKEEFRKRYILSEEMIENLSLSGMDERSVQIVKSMRIKEWSDIRRNNWDVASELLSRKFNIIKPLSEVKFNPFSLIILCDSSNERDLLRQYLISNCIYPAILWSVPDYSAYHSAMDFSKRMLSIHCDARYSSEDIRTMCQIINAFYD